MSWRERRGRKKRSKVRPRRETPWPVVWKTNGASDDNNPCDAGTLRPCSVDREGDRSSRRRNVMWPLQRFPVKNGRWGDSDKLLRVYAFGGTGHGTPFTLQRAYLFIAWRQSGIQVTATCPTECPYTHRLFPETSITVISPVKPILGGSSTEVGQHRR